MIPGIEEIILGLLNGSYTGKQAEAWIHRHIALALDTDGLRDHFAGQAMQALLGRVNEVSGDYVTNAPPSAAATEAYGYADAMLKARKA